MKSEELKIKSETIKQLNATKDFSTFDFPVLSSQLLI
ncbi:hypothetical protein SAMN05216357_10172 [Porphyromonadaceae bacterium KH3CP3RA]|nr:hypothetical protein SAMN05216357_10172 [Porphyromonadaceae bacterium KH3CP3RA]